MSKTIMIIDDDIDLVEAMRITLESAGFNVIDAQEGIKGLEIIQEKHPDLLILDVMMDTQDEGFQLAYTLRNRPDTKDLPIIMVTAVSTQTGYHFDPGKDEAFLPVDEFIEKPVNPQNLINAVNRNLPVV